MVYVIDMLTRIRQSDGPKVYVSLIDRDNSVNQSFTVYTLPVNGDETNGGRAATVAELKRLFERAIDDDCVPVGTEPDKR